MDFQHTTVEVNVRPFQSQQFAAYSAGASEGICILASFIGLLLGAVIIVISQRIKKTQNITFDIIQFNNEE